MPTNVQRLQAAKVLTTPHALSPADEAKVNGLQESEVIALVNVKNSLGDDFIKRNTSLIL